MFLQTIRDSVQHKDWFAYAAAEKDATYEGLLFGSAGVDAAVLVRPDAVHTSTGHGGNVETDGRTTKSDPPHSSTTGGAKPKNSSPPPAHATFKRFHATVGIDAQDPIGAFTEIVQNVIGHFSAQYGTVVTLTLDIETRRADGFEAKTIRVVRENANKLRFSTAELEEE